jgi:tetratricopeptide (TPR) repeat protein
MRMAAVKIARLLSTGFAGSLLLLLPVSADDRQDCRNGSPANAAIAICTRLIEIAGGTPVERAELFVDRGNAKLRSQKFDDAIADYDEAIRVHPDYGLAFNNRGLALVRKKDNERALSDFTRSIELLPKFAAPSYNRGLIYFNRGDLDRALSDFDDAIRKDPKAGRHFASRAAAHEKKAALDAALQDLDAALALESANVPWLMSRAQILQQKRDFVRALADVDTILRLQPKNGDAANLKAALRIAALPPEAATCIDKSKGAKVQLPACIKVIQAGTAEPETLAFAYNVRAESFSEKFDYDNAIADLSESIRLFPSAATYTNRGIRYRSKGEPQRAIADYDEALRLDPKYGFAFNNRGNTYIDLGDFDRGIADIDAALTFTKFVALYNNRGRAYGLKGDFERSLADFQEATKINPKGFNSPVGECEAYIALKKYDLAIERCNAAIAASGSDRHTRAIYARANAQREKGDLGAALVDYDKTLQINPNFVEGYVGRAQLFEVRKDLNRARLDYRSAAFALTPHDSIEASRARAMARQRLDILNKAQGPATPGRRVALVIGNTAYKNVSPLENPVRDADMIAKTLRGAGFQTVTLANDLTRDKFFEALRTFAVQAEKADWAVIYYAGHGLEIGGINYLVPVDAKLRADGDAASEAVALEQVIASVQGARKLKLVILDACRDNPFVPKMQRSIALRLVNKGLSNIEPESGFMVVYGAKAGETALDGEGAQNSPLATAIARNVRTPGIEVRKLFDIVRDDVMAATKKQQQPFSYGSLPGREDFYFVAAK